MRKFAGKIYVYAGVFVRLTQGICKTIKASLKSLLVPSQTGSAYIIYILPQNDPAYGVRFRLYFSRIAGELPPAGEWGRRFRREASASGISLPETLGWWRGAAIGDS